MRTLRHPTELDPSSDWHLLRIYGIYRILVALSILVLLTLSHPVVPATPSVRLYSAVAAVYAALCILSQLITRLQTGRPATQALIAIFIDIVCLAMLEHTSQSESGQLALLQIVAVAAGGILLGSRMSYFLAAMASLANLYESILDFWLYDDIAAHWTRAGYLGMSLFGTVFFTRQIASRLRQSEALAQRQAIDLANLEELNRQIIQRMRTGIIVADRTGRIRMMNDAATLMFGHQDDGLDTPLGRLSHELQARLRDWEKNRTVTHRPFRAIAGGVEVVANFTALDPSESSDILIFLDDHTRLSQQAQQLKLASLGSLTASIAHEIRNPLGAASHAAQLMAESDDLRTDDRKLSDIIYKNCVRMNAVVENVLQLSRGGPSRQELMPLNEWTKQFIDDFKHSRPTDDVIDFSGDPRAGLFRSDSSQMQQVFSNLFENGLRHSKKNSGIASLKVRTRLNETTQQPYVDILDQGGGVPENVADRIFEPFFTSEKTGTGLGLYIARELCEANQARLDYLPEPGGSCFRITFSHPDKQPAIIYSEIRAPSA
jgi:two-component system sensor histidine kinase PilS (NtrC family)